MLKRWFHTFTLALLVMTQLAAAMPAVHAASPATRRAAITAGTVTNCSDDTDFSARLSGGGAVDFNCGEATIIVGSTKVIASDTTIDGGGQITLSGGDARQIFSVAANATLTLRNITLIDGFNAGSMLPPLAK